MTGKTFEDMHKGNTINEWHIEASAEVVLDQLRRVVEDYRKKVSGDRVAELTAYVVGERREYKLFVEGSEFIDVDEKGVPHFFPVTPEKNAQYPDAVCFIYITGEGRCTLLLSVKPKKEVLPKYWESFVTSLDDRFREVKVQFRREARTGLNVERVWELLLHIFVKVNGRLVSKAVELLPGSDNSA